MTGAILDQIDAEQRAVAGRGLPGMLPVADGDWVVVDDAYSAQLAEKERLLTECGDAVLQSLPGSEAAQRAFLDVLLERLALRDDFAVGADHVVRADGVRVELDASPLVVVSRLIQEDVCILQRCGAAHCLTAALLCFPASWTLAQKVGRPLVGIHEPVPEYDGNVAARVQRLFDGVRVGQPIWRANLLRYEEAALFQPRLEGDHRGERATGHVRFERSERQTLLRLAESDTVVFTIHTSVAPIRQSG